MTIRVQNSSIINFGTLTAQTSITHARVGFGSNALTVRPLQTAQTVAAGGQAQFDTGEIDLIFPNGQMLDDGLEDLVELYFEQNVWIDAMTDSSTVVTTSGYSQQTLNTWSLSQE